MHWTVKLEGGPRRVNHAAVAFGDKIFSFGGYCSGDDFDVKRPIDVHVLDTRTNRWRPVEKPSDNSPHDNHTPYQRYGHTAVAYGGKAYIWGGRNDSEGASSVLHEYDPVLNRWTAVKATGQVPAARDGHSACVFGKQMLIFGGFEEDFQRFSQETFAFDFETKHWSELKTWGHAPAWRDFHTTTVIGNRMYIFGGRSDQLGEYHSNREIYFDKLKYLNLQDFMWYEPEVKGDKPTGRRSHSSWAYKDKLYIFGGFSGINNEHFNTLYEFNPATNTWSQMKPIGEGPTPRRRQCSIVVGGRVFLFGGTCPSDMKSINNIQSMNSNPMDRNLVDLSDLYVLEYEPSLARLAELTIIKNKALEPLKSKLPWDVRLELEFMTLHNKITLPRRSLTCG